MSAAATPAERLKRALAAATRALAGERHLDVEFGAGEPALDATRLRLPEPALPLTARGVAQLRGHADRLALRHAHHDAATHARFQPDGPPARALFDALEDLRCQALGARALAGVRGNLRAAFAIALERRAAAAAPATGANADADALVDAAALLAREQLTGDASPAAAAPLLERWRAELEQRAGPSLGELRASIADQAEFARRACALAADLALGGPAGETVTTAGGAGAAPAAETVRQAPAAGGTATPASDEEAGEPLADTRPARAAGALERAVAPAEPAARIRRPLRARVPDGRYRVYTRLHDEVLPAEQICTSGELAHLRARLDGEAARVRGNVARMANRLERLLLAQQKRQWRFDQEEGVLDAARLTRVVTDPLAPLLFRQEVPGRFRDTVVTLLLDNSGSMRGRPILLAALCADVLSRTLEHCGVKVEILGFTTRAWSGGLSRDDWLRAGCPPRPGRLSDLRYIVYKTADAPWRRARANLGVMLREDLLKENVDGEAILWAHERLLARSEQRRILLVVSDGVPLDEATLSANPGDYLDRHLRSVVAWIEERSPVELLAIGIGHDVTDYYTRAIRIRDVEQLGAALLGQLTALFASAPQRRAAGLRRA
jgi:cobaltochelatase CobT